MNKQKGMIYFINFRPWKKRQRKEEHQSKELFKVGEKENEKSNSVLYNRTSSANINFLPIKRKCKTGDREKNVWKVI